MNNKAKCKLFRALAKKGAMDIGLRCKVAGADSTVTFTSDHLVETDELIRFTSPLAGDIESISEFVFDDEYEVWRRQDRLVHRREKAVSIGHPILTFNLYGKNISVLTFTNNWCRESQPEFVDLRSGAVTIGAKGRTCSGYTPYFRVKSSSFGEVVFNLLPCGDWRVVFTKLAKDILEVAVDRYDDAICPEIAPGERLDLKLDCLIQMTAKSFPERAIHQIQGYTSDRLLKRHIESLPIVYNSWFDRFDKISVPDLQTQLEVAREVGCEVFVIDAGWYGQGTQRWSEKIGDWRESSEVFRERTLSSFADLVRSRGLEFGLWMEPQRVQASAPVRLEHKEWFIPATHSFNRALDDTYYPDLVNKQARAWVLSEMIRVIETYQLKWLKLDCNIDFSRDPHGLGHRARMEVWYSLLDELAGRFPDLVLEGCASGAMTSDLLTACHFHTYFLSDTVDPIDTIRIGMSTSCRLPPRLVERWTVLYPTGGGFTPYFNEPLDTGDLVLCPAMATSERVSSYHLDFAMRAAMPGPMGISGNLAGFAPAVRKQIAEHISFYKKHRQFILSAVSIPLTPIEPLEKRDGIAALQLASATFERNMVFVYNIASPLTKVLVKPQNLYPTSPFNLFDENGNHLAQSKGLDLMRNGFEIECSSARARIVFLNTGDRPCQD